MIKNRNEITGDKIQTKGVFSKEAEDRFDLIFRAKKEPTERNPDPDWDEGRIDVIGQNGNDGDGYGWKKHDGSTNCPENPDNWIEVETYASMSFKELASNLEWKYVKFYRVIPNGETK
jgi:hypothetical protein